MWVDEMMVLVEGDGRRVGRLRSMVHLPWLYVLREPIFAMPIQKFLFIEPIERNGQTMPPYGDGGLNVL